VTHALVQFWKNFWGIVLAAALVVGLVVGLWAGGVILSKANATAQYQIQHNGVQYQVTNENQITKNFQTLTNESVQLEQAKGDPTLIGLIKVEQDSLAGTLCSEGENVSGVVPADQAAWFHGNCLDGAVAPSSPFYISVPAS
jgi:hypothetical protein